MALQRQAWIKGEKCHAIKSLLCDMCVCIYSSILCKYIYMYMIISTIIVIIIIYHDDDYYFCYCYHHYLQDVWHLHCSVCITTYFLSKKKLHSSLMHMIILITTCEFLWVEKALIHRGRSCHQDDCCPCWWWDWTRSHGWDSEGRMAHKSCQKQLASCCMKIQVSFYIGFSYGQPWKIRQKPTIGSLYICFLFPSKLW